MVFFGGVREGFRVVLVCFVVFRRVLGPVGFNTPDPGGPGPEREGGGPEFRIHNEPLTFAERNEPPSAEVIHTELILSKCVALRLCESHDKRVVTHIIQTPDAATFGADGGGW